MTAKNMWVKSSSGPDWTDVLMMVSALEGIHECRIVLTVTVASQGHNGGARVGLMAHFERLPNSDMFRTVSTEMNYPNATCATMEGTVYNLAWQLDHKIGAAHEQMRIPE